MKIFNKYKKWLWALGLAVGLFACEDVDPLIESITYDRAFSPLYIEVTMRNQINAEIDWQVVDSVEKYVLQIHNDSMEFNSLVLEQEVLPTEVPVTIGLEGEEMYSVRIKAISNIEGQDESKWNGIAFESEAENIFTGTELGKTDVDTWVTLTWPANSEVTHLIVNPDAEAEKIVLTADEIAAGSITIENLPFGTTYTIKMYNGDSPKQRGSSTFTTIPEGDTLYPEDDLSEIIANAEDGDVFLLSSGEYTAYQGKISLNKSIKLKALTPDDKPVLNVQFVIGVGVSYAEFYDIEMYGKYTDEVEGAVDLDFPFQFEGDGVDIGDLVVSGCYIHNYYKSLVGAGSGAFTVNSVTIDDCIVQDWASNGGDFIDFRASFPAAITVTNSTFINVATETTRDFVRLDGAAKGNTYDDGAHTPVITLQYNTFYNVMNNASSTKRFFYVRWQNSDEVLISKNNLFYDMGASVYSNQGDTNMPTCDGNNYYNAAGYYDTTQKAYDAGSYTTLDPGFADVTNDDFTLSNQTLIDGQVGDPRWR